MSKETIGPRIKAFRKGRGITQAELAKTGWMALDNDN